MIWWRVASGKWPPAMLKVFRRSVGYAVLARELGGAVKLDDKPAVREFADHGIVWIERLPIVRHTFGLKHYPFMDLLEAL